MSACMVPDQASIHQLSLHLWLLFDKLTHGCFLFLLGSHPYLSNVIPSVGNWIPLAHFSQPPHVPSPVGEAPLPHVVQQLHCIQFLQAKVE